MDDSDVEELRKKYIAAQKEIAKQKANITALQNLLTKEKNTNAQANQTIQQLNVQIATLNTTITNLQKQLD
ncbi:hypothetical protein, partial [Oenococcus oeni]|uniref:hypothetical protein n=1 Tax=Oenococcus oeni TaxID=1247 RepID=UPI0011812EA5